MLDRDTFLTALYVFIDDYVQTHPAARRPGPAPHLSPSEVLTLLVFSRWRRFASERDFYRYARRELRGCFPTLPDRSQFVRQARHCYPLLAGCLRQLARQLGAEQVVYQVLDLTPVPVRDAKRRGSSWLEGQAALGHSTRLGWFFGFQLLLSVTPAGVITGFALAPGSTKDQPLADDFLQARAAQMPAAAGVGDAYAGPYVADKGFEGMARRGHGQVLTAPKGRTRRRWSKPWRRWLARRRQIVEAVNDKLHHDAGLSRARGRLHSLRGQLVHVAAACTLHNLLAWLNMQLERPLLAFAELFHA